MDSLIFDLDGTLWDATRPAYEALLEIEKKYGSQLTSYKTFLSLMGKPMDEIAASTLLGLEEAKKYQLFKEFYQLELELIRKGGSFLFPGVEKTLRELEKHYPLFIISNAQEGYIETFLEVHRMEEVFVDILSWGQSPQAKGKNILLMMEKHGLDSPIYIGDTRGDEEAARLAKIPYYHVDYGFGQAQSPDRRLEGFEELLELIEGGRK